jgi:hypothetical protein
MSKYTIQDQHSFPPISSILYFVPGLTQYVARNQTLLRSSLMPRWVTHLQGAHRYAQLYDYPTIHECVFKDLKLLDMRILKYIMFESVKAFMKEQNTEDLKSIENGNFVEYEYQVYEYGVKKIMSGSFTIKDFFNVFTEAYGGYFEPDDLGNFYGVEVNHPLRNWVNDRKSFTDIDDRIVAVLKKMFAGIDGYVSPTTPTHTSQLISETCIFSPNTKIEHETIIQMTDIQQLVAQEKNYVSHSLRQHYNDNIVLSKYHEVFLKQAETHTGGMMSVTKGKLPTTLMSTIKFVPTRPKSMFMQPTTMQRVVTAMSSKYGIPRNISSTTKEVKKATSKNILTKTQTKSIKTLEPIIKYTKFTYTPIFNKIRKIVQEQLKMLRIVDVTKQIPSSSQSMKKTVTKRKSSLTQSAGSSINLYIPQGNPIVQSVQVKYPSIKTLKKVIDDIAKDLETSILEKNHVYLNMEHFPLIWDDIVLPKNLVVFRGTTGSPKLSTGTRYFGSFTTAHSYMERASTNDSLQQGKYASVWACEIKENTRVLDARTLKYLLLEYMTGLLRLGEKGDTAADRKKYMDEYNVAAPKFWSVMIAYGLVPNRYQVEIMRLLYQRYEKDNQHYHPEKYTDWFTGNLKWMGDRISLNIVDDDAMEFINMVVGDKYAGVIAPQMKTQWHSKWKSVFRCELALFDPSKSLENAYRVCSVIPDEKTSIPSIKPSEDYEYWSTLEKTKSVDLTKVYIDYSTRINDSIIIADEIVIDKSRHMLRKR